MNKRLYFEPEVVILERKQRLPLFCRGFAGGRAAYKKRGGYER